MNKKFITLLLAASMVMGLTACGSSSAADSTEATETAEATGSVAAETEAGTEETVEVNPYEYDTPASSTFTYKAAEQVTSLADYSNIAVTVDSSYEVTEDAMNAYLVRVFDYVGADSTVEITDRDIIQEGDTVDVDYTGYVDGEAFDNGSATDQMVEVSDDNGYIDGFTNALVGAKVGDTVTGNVTFPEDYASTELAGQDAEFEFVIHGIYRSITFDDLTDEMVADACSEQYDFSTVEDLRDVIEETLQDNLLSAEIDEIDSYMLDNSTVDVPEDYQEARLNEYIYLLAQYYCSDGQTFEEYCSENSMTLDDVKEDIAEYIHDQIALEWIYEVVAEKEGYTLDEDEFNDNMTSALSYYGYSDANTMFEYYGYGDAVAGEAYLRKTMLQNETETNLAENNTTVTFSTDTETAQ